jgi:hypothetical protein
MCGKQKRRNRGIPRLRNIKRRRYEIEFAVYHFNLRFVGSSGNAGSGCRGLKVTPRTRVSIKVLCESPLWWSKYRDIPSKRLILKNEARHLSKQDCQPSGVDPQAREETGIGDAITRLL